MICSQSGKFTVAAAAPGGMKKEGIYKYDSSSSQISAEPDGLIGQFSCDPISKTPISIDCQGRKELPKISIVNSEIMKEIQNPDNEGAYFVLASQFNGAEFPSESSVVGQIDEYKFDRTGGPRGQLAVHPAAGQFILDNAETEERKGINALLELLSAWNAAGLELSLKNGYLVIPTLDQSTAKTAMDVLKRNLHTVRILCMQNLPATGLTPNHMGLCEATHRVNIVYAAAVPVQCYMNPREADQGLFQLQIAEALSTAQYYGSLKKAAADGKPKIVYWMALGGGVFNNDWDTIVGSMSKAVEMLTQVELDTLDIRVLAWVGSEEEKDTLIEKLRACGKLRLGTKQSGKFAPAGKCCSIL